MQKRNFWQLQAEIHHRGRYCHPYSMDITVTRNSPTGQAMTADAEAAVSEALRDLAFGRFMEEACIWFSGFCSQGDGACFEGRWHWQPATARRLREYATQDHELHRIADALQAVQKRNFWQLQAEIHHRGRYCHPYSMDITVTRNSPTGQAMTADAEAAVSEALRDLAFWLYRQLENEYDRLTSDAAVDEALLINEYTFTEAGLRAG